jgi:hypothetical protein
MEHLLQLLDVRSWKTNDEDDSSAQPHLRRPIEKRPIVDVYDSGSAPRIHASCAAIFLCFTLATTYTRHLKFNRNRIPERVGLERS